MNEQKNNLNQIKVVDNNIWPNATSEMVVDGKQSTSFLSNNSNGTQQIMASSSPAGSVLKRHLPVITNAHEHLARLRTQQNHGN